MNKTAGNLTAKQRRFVAEYLVDLNATQAAIRAGYSAATARQIGQENLSKPVIQETIGAAQAKRAEKTARTALAVLRDIQDVSRQARDEGDLKTALKGLELEGKHIGMFTDKVSLDTKQPPIVELVLSAPAPALDTA